MRLYCGTSGWAYAAWKPSFYPPKTAQKDFLRYYSSQLSAVEVNYTFRSVYALNPDLARKWIEQSAESFCFAFKAPQAITHGKSTRLENCSDLVEQFTLRLRPFAEAGKLGPVLLQLPPFLKANAVVLDSFLRGWPPGIRCAFEFRHQSWFAPAIYDVLHKHNAALCIAQTDKIDTPAQLTADFVYYRLRRRDYSQSDLAAIQRNVHEQLTTHDVYAFFKHEDESVVSTERALALQSTLSQRAA